MADTIKATTDKTRFIKSDLIEYLSCKKSAWLQNRRPDAVAWSETSAFESLLAQDGYEVESIAEQYIASLWKDGTYTFQVEFETEEGLFSRSDIVKFHGEKTIELFEVKAATSLKKKGKTIPLLDAAFQAIVASDAGYKVEKITVIHVNKDYVKSGEINAEELLTFADVTEEVSGMMAAVRGDIALMVEYLSRTEIESDTCECLSKPSRNQHCDSFSFFNPDIPDQPAYWLPRLSKAKLEAFINTETLSLFAISEEGLTSRQKRVLAAAQQKAPQINYGSIRSFLEKLNWPLHFYDYETVARAVPMSDGFKPYDQIPVQYSLHVLSEDGTLAHVEYLAEGMGSHDELILSMKENFSENGSVISWNKPFENTCNKTLAGVNPEHEPFLLGINERTVDLMDVFKEDYVDINFQGSVSIKKVLPVLCPDVAYNEDAVHEGAGAMAAFLESISTDDANKRNRLRSELRDYCEIDSLAMVKIYQFLKSVID